LRQHIEVLGYKKNFVIYNESEQLAAVKKILSHISAKGEAIDPKVVLTFLSRHKNGVANSGAVSDESNAVLRATSWRAMRAPCAPATRLILTICCC